MNSGSEIDEQHAPVGRDALVERQIAAAHAAGLFKELKDFGKPLNLDRNPHLDPAWWLAFHVLENAGFAPAWVEERRNLEQAIAERRKLWQQRSVSDRTHSGGYPVETITEMEGLNKRIDRLNLSVPHRGFRLARLKPESELPESK